MIQLSPHSKAAPGSAIWTACLAGSPHVLPQNRTMPQNPPVIDLFSGCGGLSLGFREAGFDIVAAFDSWTAAVEVYRGGVGPEAAVLDLSDEEAAQAAIAPFFDGSSPAIIGGPPCQDFSSAGARVEGDRADLTAGFARLVARFRPPFAVMENVARSARAEAYRRAVEIMEGAGYEVRSIVLDASLCGVPQTRKRLFTVAAPEGAAERAVALMRERQAARPMTVREALPGIGIDRYYQHPRHYARRAVFSVDEPSPTIRSVNRPVPPDYRPHDGDAGPATRALTLEERAAIQTFPPGFRFGATKTAAEQMVGNAVPPRLAEHVARAVRDALGW